MRNNIDHANTVKCNILVTFASKIDEEIQAADIQIQLLQLDSLPDRAFYIA